MPNSQSGASSGIIIHGDYNDIGPSIQIISGERSDNKPQPTYAYVPPRPLSPRFTGQVTYLQRLRDYFGQPITQKPQRRCFLLHGTGGVGKTQLALKYAEESADRYWIFWVDASSIEMMEQSLKAIAEDPVAKAAGVEPSTRSVLQWFSRVEHEWLLIFDNANGDPNTVGKYIPPGDRGNILFTSRNPMMGNFVPSPRARVEVDGMDETDAVILLLKSAMLDNDNSPSHLIKPAGAIARKLCCLPLAVDQAGAAIASGLCTIHDYLQLYARHRHKLLTFRSFEGASDSDRAVYATLDVSYKAIEASASGASGLLKSRAARVAIFLLEIFAFFHHENILEEIIKRAAEIPVETSASRGTKEDLESWSAYALYWLCCRRRPVNAALTEKLLQLDDSRKWDPWVFREGVRILISFSLIKKGTGRGYFEHPLVHSWSRDRMPNELQKARCRSASALLAQSIDFKKTSSDYAFRRDLVPHIMSCSSYTAGLGLINICVEQECVKFACVYNENGLWNHAEVLLKQVLKGRKRDLGEEHSDTLTSIADLALTFWSQGRYAEAKELQLRVLAVRERVLGEEHTDTLTSMASLASTFRRQGLYNEAKELEDRVLAVRKRVLGEEHPDTLSSMHNLTSIFRRQGRYAEAEKLQVQVLAVRQRILGEEHRDTLTTMANLTSTYRKQGRYSEAEELQARVLEVMKRVLGEEHPDTLASMHNLASTFRRQGRYGEAKELQAQVLAARKRVLGEEHPDTLTTMVNLASTFQKQGRSTEAEALLVRVLAVRKEAFGEEHPDTLTSMANLATTYLHQGHHRKAEVLEVRVLAVRRKILGEEHPHTLASMSNLTSIFRRQGRHSEAQELLRKLVESMTEVLGSQHPDTVYFTKVLDEIVMVHE